jgi:hypothetical protein
VRQARQWPQVTMRSGLLGSPHSGQSTVASEPACAFSTCWVRAAWTASSPPQGQPRWAWVQRAVSLAMARLLGVRYDGTQLRQPPGGFALRVAG